MKRVKNKVVIPNIDFQAHKNKYFFPQVKFKELKGGSGLLHSTISYSSWQKI